MCTRGLEENVKQKNRSPIADSSVSLGPELELEDVSEPRRLGRGRKFRSESWQGISISGFDERVNTSRVWNKTGVTSKVIAISGCQIDVYADEYILW